MTNRLIVILMFIIPAVFAQNCKPDLDRTDKITKQANLAWEAIVHESGFGSSLVNTSSWRITVQLGRYTDNNLFTVFISKSEESAQNASFETQYQPQNGKPILFAFTQGEPLIIKVQSSNVSSKMDNIIGKLVTTITLSATLTPEQIQAIKKSFNEGNANAIRINLANNLMIEKDINPKRAEKLTAKVNCFMAYNEASPAKVQAVADLPTFPIDETTHKVTYTEVITDESNTPAKQLYGRAKKWMIDYFKDTQIKIDMPEEGNLSRTGKYLQTFNTTGKVENDEISYTVSISVKDGKYKYSITDLVDDDGKHKAPAEALAEMLKTAPPAVAALGIKQFNEGVNKVIENLKEAMKTDAKKSDW